MRKRKFLIFRTLLLIISLSSISVYAQNYITKLSSVREKLLMDFGWRFHLGDLCLMKNDFEYGSGMVFAKSGDAVEPDKISFNDSSWQKINLPHDWAVGLKFVKSDDWQIKSHGFKPIGREFPQTSIGWYRKTFVISKADSGKIIEVHFDGVFRDCIVWFNGHYLGNNLSGYSEFQYDITNYINYDNIICFVKS